MEGEPWAMLVVSALAREESFRAQGLRGLEASFGPLAFLSQPLPFDYTDYYAAEMGSPLTRRLAAFSRLRAMHSLAQAKAVCQDIERELSHQGRRRLNLDPGLLGPGSLALASSKPSPHRLALAPGTFAEVTLLYQRGGWRALPWTYPDYAGRPLGDILLQLRRRYMWLLKQARDKEGDSCSSQ